MRAFAIVILALAGCPPKPAPVPVITKPAVTPDAPPASQEEQLAAIQKAMNELDEAVQQCWAVVATEKVDVHGDLVAQIDILPVAVEGATANATLVQDTAHDVKLAACVVNVFEHYPWAPPIRGTSIQLPFQVRAPNDGQNVIDRRLVTANGQGNVRISVLLDQANSGNPMASMFEVDIADKATTGMRRADRAELWYFVTAASVNSAAGKPIEVAAGDMLYVPVAGVREIVASHGALKAMLVMTPGGAEGSARAGALPTPEQTSWRKSPPAPVLLAAATAKTYPRGQGKVTIFAEGDGTKTPGIAATLLEFPLGMTVPEHVHDKETEMLYVLAGTGTMTVKTDALAVIATSVVQVPPATKHSFTTTSDLRAIQIYTPAGPEQRFKAK